MIDSIAKVVKSRAFEVTVLCLIVFASVLVGLETYPELLRRYGVFFKWANTAVLAFFGLEIVLKMASHGRHFLRYFKDPWNVFDFLVVVVCMIPLQAGYAAVLRMARIMRALRLTTALPRLQLLVGALIKSIPSMIYVGLLLGLCFYVYAVLGVFLFGGNDPMHFHDLPNAMLTLFCVVTLEGWIDIFYAQMYGTDVYEITNSTGITATPAAQPLAAVAYFVSFIMLATMIMLNLFIGVIINSMDEVQTEQNLATVREQKAQHRAPTMAEEISEIELQLEKLQESMKMLRLISQRAEASAADHRLKTDGESHEVRREEVLSG